MSNVVPFRPSQQSWQPEAITTAPVEPRRCRIRSALEWGVAALLGVVCFAAFLALMTLRRPVQFVLGIGTVGGVLALVMIALGCTGQGKDQLLWMTGGMTAVCAALSWFYDTLLLRLSPTPIILS